LAPTRKQIFETAPTRSNLIAPHILKSLWNMVTKHDEIGSCGEYRINVSGPSTLAERHFVDPAARLCRAAREYHKIVGEGGVKS